MAREKEIQNQQSETNSSVSTDSATQEQETPGSVMTEATTAEPKSSNATKKMATDVAHLSDDKNDTSKTETPSAHKQQKNTRRISNNLREFRIEQMMSKAELARKAGLSVLTIDRIEKGFGCRMDTKRKILKALGLKLSDRRKVFLEE